MNLYEKVKSRRLIKIAVWILVLAVSLSMLGIYNAYAEDNLTAKTVTKTSSETAGKLTLKAKEKTTVRKAAAADTENSVQIKSLSTQLFYGAKKTSDGTYVWTVPYNDTYKAGHRFAYRISFSTSGVGTAEKGAVTFRIPKFTLKNRSGNSADTVEFSIPSKKDVEESAEEDIDNDVSYAYYEDGDDYVIYNFREVSAGSSGYFELAYSTTRSSFSYKDMEEQTPFTCRMTVKNGDSDEDKDEKEADAIKTAIDTSAEVTSTDKQYPGNRIKSWRSSWGNAVKPDDTSKYYYLVWPVKSYISANQPYDFSISDTLTSNLAGSMKVLGYMFSGQDGFSKTNSVKNQTINDYRYDYVLTAIPLDDYQSSSYWSADNKVKVTLTPADGKDSTSTASSSKSWSWSKPVFAEPGGFFNTFKRGDGAYRRYSPDSVFWGTRHYADSRNFSADEYSRYDLENFNGYDGASKTLSSYDGFDFASWIVGNPGSYTADGDKSDPENYWKKNVKYELTDEGFFLLNDNSALASSDGSSKRTIENGGIKEEVDGRKTAIKLTSDDFRIDSIEWSSYIRDAELDEETQAFQSKSPTYSDTDVIYFYGKFGSSDEWVKFGEYNLKEGKATPVDTYVDSMTSSRITFKEGQDLTAYKVETENTHYYTEIYTVPNITLKNSDAVTGLLSGATDLILLNNNTGNFYQKDRDEHKTVGSVYHSDTDYACVSKKESSLSKDVVSVSNITKKKIYDITWKLTQKETVTTGKDGSIKNIAQNGGTFFDLLPEGSDFDSSSVLVYGDESLIDESDYDVKTIDNYKGSGRTLLVINIGKKASNYYVYFDTRHSWNSIKDYGTDIHNPAAYETGNGSITKGFADNAGTVDSDGNSATSPFSGSLVSLMSGLSKGSGMTDTDVTDPKFIYTQNSWDILALTSASSGLTKKVKADDESAYSVSSGTTINGNYSYELRYANNYSGGSSKNIILFDSLENYNPDSSSIDSSGSDWRGTLKSIDVSQIKKKGADVKIYVSKKEGLDPETSKDLSDTGIWSEVTDDTDLSDAKAVAMDCRKNTDGKDFVLGEGDSIVAHLYMKAPASAPESEGNLPYAYNNVYMQNSLFDPENSDDNGTEYFIHQDYTKTSLTVTGDLKIIKKDSKTDKTIPGISFRATGTSAYGTEVDITKKTGSGGILTLSDLEKGTYTVQETDATDDYQLDSTQHKVTVTGEGKTLWDGEDITDSGVTIKNKPRVHADVSFRKVSSLLSSLKLAGAKYMLLGTSDYGNAVMKVATSKTGDGEDSEDKGLVEFGNIEKGTYTLKEIQAPDGYVLDTKEYRVVIDENGDYTVSEKLSENAYRTKNVTKYSHTPNISDDGTQNGSYANSANYYGVGYVVSIPGAEKLHVKIIYGGESASYDWACMWKGNQPTYTAGSNHTSSVTGKLGGGSHTSSSNTKEYDIDDDTVTFAFRSDGSGTGDGYGYYAVITSQDTGVFYESEVSDADKTEDNLLKKKGEFLEVSKDSLSTYLLKDEPLHEIVFAKKSSYDKSVVGGAEFSLTGVSDLGTTVNKTATSDDTTGTVRIDGLEAGTYTLKETKAPDGFENNDTSYLVHVNTDGTYSIRGLQKDTLGIYELYNTKSQDKTIDVTKVWDDGVSHTDPNKDLAITIQTEVPEKSTRTFSVIYDANGGSFN